MTNKHIYLCIHGHFYQPPRENPWIEAVELQESAAPFHDWNERIHHECYLPNALARVLDDKWQIVDIVNNYENINFNFGPTLLSWLKDKHPRTYQFILDSDHASRSLHNGHGNAIAQVYNHMIMPLANRRDKVTQVKWALEDFKSRFGRGSEGIWLPETACNEETLEVLVEEGVKFVILSPYQAERVKPLGGGNWVDVSSGQIDPKVPYRCFMESNPEKYIDIFFYDGPISRAVGFEDVAFESKRYMEKIRSAVVDGYYEGQLIHVAVDGETYGHHKPFADRALAYLLHLEAPKNGIKVVNYGEFLEMCSPRYEVKIKKGENGEGTSWSCAHGVGRWKEHCGCRGGGPGEWTQHWRKPLRDALDWLRDELFIQFLTLGGEYFKQVWEARDEYIQVVLDRSEKNITAFFERHARRPLTRREISLCLKLLEIQRNAMLMYTSCGWFFTEISGIETVQILQYAARAIQLSQEVGTASQSALHHDLEKDFLKKLSFAKSNMTEFKDGRGVYEKLVRPSMVGFPEMVSHYAIDSMFEDFPENIKMHAFEMSILNQRKESSGDMMLNLGRVRIKSTITLEESDLIFIAAQFGTYDFRCSVKPFLDAAELEKMEKEFFEDLHSVHLVELNRKMDDYFGKKYYSLKDLFLENRLKIISMLTRESIRRIGDVYEDLYEANRKMNEVYRSINVPIPQEIRFAAEHTLTRRLKKAVEQLAASNYDSRKMVTLTQIIEVAKSFHVQLNKKEIAGILSRDLIERTGRLRMDLRPEVIAACLNILKIAKKMDVELALREAQDYVFSRLKEWRDSKEAFLKVPNESVDRFLELAAHLQIETGNFKKGLIQN